MRNIVAIAIFGLLSLMLNACQESQSTDWSTTQESWHDMVDFGDGEIGAPKQPKGWSTRGTLTTYDESKTVSLQQVFPDADNYTVSFARTINAVHGADQPQGIVECEALISWSVAGNTITRRVDVISGMSVSGLANAVQVVVRDKTVQGVVANYDVTITVAPGSRASNQIQPFLKAGDSTTNPVTLTAGGGTESADFDVPQDAGVNSVFVATAAVIVAGAAAPIPEQAVQVIHLGTATGPILAAYDPRSEGWVPLAPGTTVVRVINVSGGPDQLLTVFFGIDG